MLASCKQQEGQACDHQIELVYSVELGGEARHGSVEVFADLFHLYQEAVRLDRFDRALHHHPLLQHLSHET
jgi:hypothetical protein